jgi:hypothetical protein
MTSRAFADLPGRFGRVLWNMKIPKGIDLVGSMHDLHNKFDREFTVGETR